MSCSSNRNRLVGSCIRTLVSRTKSLLAGTRRGAAPDFADLADLRGTRVKGAGRILRSTMSLLEDVDWDKRSAPNRLPSMLARRFAKTQAMGPSAGLRRHVLW